MLKQQFIKCSLVLFLSVIATTMFATEITFKLDPTQRRFNKLFLRLRELKFKKQNGKKIEIPGEMVLSEEHPTALLTKDRPVIVNVGDDISNLGYNIFELPISGENVKRLVKRSGISFTPGMPHTFKVTVENGELKIKQIK